LKDAGLLAGKRFTSHAGVLPELPDSLVGERVVEDGGFITSRGAATAVDFGLALVRRLCGEAAAAEVAKGIMA
jgi:4-methyl-5(b-hydroxyethyl)-thiazole monophosphate biosynthesis